ncbi:MAG: HugZ family pyridoxamine 5'-phosphate oxidase [Planctomycetota bacterium]|jgi:putative heme iron utilization protein
MTDTRSDPLADAQQAYRTFPDGFRSVVLATVDGRARPHASYAPFVMDEQHRIHCLLSGMAEHAANVEATGRASVMFLEDESAAAQIFARRRLTFDCRAEFLAIGDPARDDVRRRFVERFGSMAERLLSMPDFRPVRFTPTSGRFVIGFGAAYDVDGGDLGQLVPQRGDRTGHGHGKGHGHGAAPAADGGLPEAAVAGIVEHMNADHAEAVLGYARFHGRRPDATAARLLGLDARGLDLHIDTPTGGEPLRVPFREPLQAVAQAKDVLIRMAQEARTRTENPGREDAAP